MLTGRPWCSVAFALAACAGGALAQPRLVIIPLNEDLDATGAKTVGRVVEWTNNPTGYPSAKYVPYIWERGSGFTRVPGNYVFPTMVRGSSDFSALVSDLKNDENWGNLNCFGGYCSGSMQGCTPGEPRPPLNPCVIPNITHRWTAATGWINAGSLARLLDPGSGRFYGGTHCTITINQPYDISGNGRFIVGGAWWTSVTNATGGPAYGLCGNYYAFRYDAQLDSFQALASNDNSRTTRADRVSDDGSVITGYDLGQIIDPVYGAYTGRRMCVWTNGVQTMLDSLSDNASIWPVNHAGTCIAGGPKPLWNQATFGIDGVLVIRWVRQPDNTWTPQNLGRPADRVGSSGPDVPDAIFVSAISDDGNTIVGSANYPEAGVRPFIWRPTLNGGVPIDLTDWLTSIDPGGAIFTPPGLIITSIRELSADANTMTVDLTDKRDYCANGGRSLATLFGGVLYLNGSTIACDPPRIVMGPNDWPEVHDLPGLGVALNVTASGSWPLNYQWQREDPANPGNWVDLVDDCSAFNGGFSPQFHYEGVHKSQARVGQFAETALDRVGRYRVVVSNACGSATSQPAMITFEVGGCCLNGGTYCITEYRQKCATMHGRFLGVGTTCPATCPCPADLDNGSGTGVFDGAVTIEDLLYFLAQFTAGAAGADLDNGSGDGVTDGAVTIEDLLYLLTHYQGGC